MADPPAIQSPPEVGPATALPRTLNELFFAVVKRNLPRVMMHRLHDTWIATSSRDLQRTVAGVSGALQSWGIGRGDRVAILSENRPEWTIADFASLLLGAATVPIYPTLTPDQAAHLLQDSGARVLFLSSLTQLQKFIPVRDRTQVERVVVMDDGVAGAVHMGEIMRHGPEQLSAELVEQSLAIAPDDLATLIYTSGTTGIPKGVMLTHGNVTSNLTCSLGGFDVAPGDISLSFLPLSHITARHVDLAVLFRGGCLAYVPFVEQLPQALLEVRPTFFVGVPRVYEKVHVQAEQKAKDFPASWVLRWALATGRSHMSQVLASRTPTSPSWKLANRLVFSKIRQGMGGRVRVFISGGAPLGRALAAWYASVGIRLHEGYGLTETSPVIAVNTPLAHKLGTVGKPLPNLEVRIAEDGEILVRGPSVFKEYWKNPQETQNAFVDGWFKTGDIGNLDADGFLSVTDRKKDLLKTSGGKFIAPQPIENSLKHNALVAEAVIIGDKRKFPAVLISPYFPLLEDWAKTNHVPFANRQELVSHPRVVALYEGIVEQLNRDLARFEKLKRVLLVAEEFSAADGTLTASMKLRRRVVEKRYEREIEEMYQKAEESTVPAAQGSF
jgi:long-chain acyl-CoA synthetase